MLPRHQDFVHRIFTCLPSVGEMVTLTFDDFSPTLTIPGPRNRKTTWDLVGKLVVKDQRINSDPECIAIHVEGSPVPIRIVNVNDIRAVNGKKLVHVTKPNEVRATYTILGSRGAEYTVTRKGNDWRCDCIAGNFGRLCKHVTEAKEKYS